MPIIAHEHYCATCDDKWICGMPECPLPDTALCPRCATPSKGMAAIATENARLRAALELAIDYHNLEPWQFAERYGQYPPDATTLAKRLTEALAPQP